MSDQRRDEHWRPILTGSLQETAWVAIRAIAEVSRTDVDWTGPGAVTLAGGGPGLALLHTYLFNAGEGDEHADLAVESLQRTIERLIEAQPPSIGLLDGLVGLGWALEHISERTFDFGGAEVTDGMDRAVRAYVAPSERIPPVDLTSGLAGVGLYALERSRVPDTGATVEAIVARLRSIGPSWLPVPPRRVECGTPGSKASAPTPRRSDIDVAHGLPGVIGFLGRACAADFARAEARPLLDAAVESLLESYPRGLATPGAAIVGGERASSGWCVGDPGVAATLLLAARCVGESSWEAVALDAARSAAQRQLTGPSLASPGLCHGVAGAGHIFNRFFQSSGEEVFRDAAVSCFEMLLDTRREGQPLAGFAVPMSKEIDDLARLGFLVGTAGIGLGLLAAVCPLEPAWDRVLLVSAPPIV